MQKDIVSVLIGKFVAGTHSEEETLQLKETIKDATATDYEWLLAYYEQQLSAFEPTGEPDQKLFDRIQQQIKAMDEDTIVRPGIRWWKYAAAAVLLIGMVVAGLKLYYQPSASKLAKNIEIKPGGNKAVLQLADGSKLQLDSSNKVINVDDRTVKQNNGQLQYITTNKSATTYNVLTTPRGGQFSVVLSDGTRVTLNAASYLRYPTEFTGTERKVTLIGEAYFEVAEDEKHPFKVVSGNKVVEVLGTEFNVMAYPEEPGYQATLVTGKVQVHVADNSAVSLTPGSMAEVRENGNIDVLLADIEKVTAWKNGYLSLNNSSFKALMRQVERWYDVEVKYEGIVPDRQFGGFMGRNVQLSTLIQFIKKNGINIRQEGRTIIIMP
ncbi:FecR family protein [Chitinophaga silvatica]|nr:FecR family protein [Chitinophaga silvatica]